MTGAPTTDQVTVCGGLFAPATAAESWIVAEPDCGLAMDAAAGTTVTPVTVATGKVCTMTVALPQTAVLNVEQASMATVPAVTAVTSPVALTVAMAVLVERQVTVVAMPASALTEAVIWSCVPTWMVAGFGPTLMLCTPSTGGAGGVTVTSSPHAATPNATRPDHSRER